MGIEWTDEKIESLIALAKEGWSGSEIAANLGCSRNAVLGRLHRMGMRLNAKTKEPVSVAKVERFFFNEEHYDFIREKAKQGLTAAAITVHLERAFNTPFKYSSVRSKMLELGLKVREIRRHVERKAKEKPAPSPAPVKQPGPPDPAPVGGVRFLDIAFGQCRYPIGDPRDIEVFRFCGAGVQGSTSYCKSHAALCFVSVRRETTEANRAKAKTIEAIQHLKQWI